MKISSCFLALLSLIAVAAPSLAEEASVSPPPPASVRPVAADSSSCPGDGLQFLASATQSPAALPAAIGPFPRPKCGACSTWGCVGVTWFAQCQNGQPFSGLVCVDIGVCTADGSLQCDCRPPQ
jgi:hypothetical protein